MTIFTSPICESLPTYKLIYLERSRKTPPRYSLFLSVSATCVPRWRAIDPGPEFCTHCSKKLPCWEFFAGTASGREKSLLRPSALSIFVIIPKDHSQLFQVRRPVLRGQFR